MNNLSPYKIAPVMNINKNKHYSVARWISGLFLLVSIILLIYTYYRAEIIFQGGKSATYLKYYFISFAGILFWGVVLGVREHFRANIVTIAISFIIGLYIFEVGLTILGYGQPFKNYKAIESAERLGIEFDHRTKIEVVEDLIAKNVDAVLAVRPRNILAMSDSLLPLAGISNKTTVSGSEGGQRMVYLSDRYGFNNPDSEWDVEELEWFLTGDSFTEGIAVKPSEDIAGQLRILSQKSAINAGMSGNGPLIELAELVEYASEVKPKKVLWLYYEGNDLLELSGKKINPLLMRYLEEGFSQNLINRQEEIDDMLLKFVLKEQMHQNSKKQSHELMYKFRWLRLQATRNIIRFDSDIDIDPIFSEILAKAKSRVKAWGGELYFVYLPEYSRYDEKMIFYDHSRKKSEVIGLVQELNIPVIDIHEDVFENHIEPLALFPLKLRGHYNAEGYSKVAKAILTFINRIE
jgi:hypothetical protein